MLLQDARVVRRWRNLQRWKRTITAPEPPCRAPVLPSKASCTACPGSSGLKLPGQSTNSAKNNKRSQKNEQNCQNVVHKKCSRPQFYLGKTDVFACLAPVLLSRASCTAFPDRSCLNLPGQRTFGTKKAPNETRNF